MSLRKICICSFGRLLTVLAKLSVLETTRKHFPQPLSPRLIWQNQSRCAVGPVSGERGFASRPRIPSHTCPVLQLALETPSNNVPTPPLPQIFVFTCWLRRAASWVMAMKRSNGDEQWATDPGAHHTW